MHFYSPDSKGSSGGVHRVLTGNASTLRSAALRCELRAARQHASLFAYELHIERLKPCRRPASLLLVRSRPRPPEAHRFTAPGRSASALPRGDAAPRAGSLGVANRTSGTFSMSRRRCGQRPSPTRCVPYVERTTTTCFVLLWKTPSQNVSRPELQEQLRRWREDAAGLRTAYQRQHEQLKQASRDAQAELRRRQKEEAVSALARQLGFP